MSHPTDSDKYFWHRYTNVYLAAFEQLGTARKVVEFGVYRSASIRWLAECFPSARVFGIDILPQLPTWPATERFSYFRLDQANRSAVRAALAEIGDGIDLIIEDGSHVPQHQATCLAEGLARLRSGGLYILEDIHASHPLNRLFAKHNFAEGRRLPNALNALMAIQHLKDTGRHLSLSLTAALAHPAFLSEEDLGNLFCTIAQTQILKRTQLPLYCYACHGNDFDYVEWRCHCGVSLYDPADSMTALVWKN